nr:MAG TPA: hyaluronidase [Caudoviricetes sp.]
MSDLYNTRIKLKRDTEENWTSKNPILLDGEMIIVKTNDGKIRKKIGDGVKKFSELPYDEITIDSAISTTSTNPVQNKVITLALDGKAGTAVATTSANGLMSNADKAKLDGIELGANKTTVPTALKNPNALTIEIGNTTVTYDGSTAQTVTIADGTEVAY